MSKLNKKKKEFPPSGSCLSLFLFPLKRKREKRERCVRTGEELLRD
jgi:hypothetical protein